MGEKTSSRFQLPFCPDITFSERPIKAPRKTTTMLSGRYWNPVWSIEWISRMPNMITQMTKNSESEELCSCSTAWESIRGGSVTNVDAFPLFVVLALPDAEIEGVTFPSGLLTKTSETVWIELLLSVVVVLLDVLLWGTSCPLMLSGPACTNSKSAAAL